MQAEEDNVTNGLKCDGEEEEQEITVSLESLDPSVRDAALQALVDQGIDLSKNKVNVISKDGGKTLMLVPVPEESDSQQEETMSNNGSGVRKSLLNYSV